LEYLVLGLIAGAAAVERKGFLQAMLSRPIALAPIIGLALGDGQGGLFLAPALELYWLGAVSLGAAVPVHEALGTAVITGGAVLAGKALGTGVDGAVAVLAVLLGAPIATLGRRADGLVERWNERLAVQVEARMLAGQGAAALRLNLWGLAVPFAIGLCLAPVGAAVAAEGIPGILRRAPSSRPYLDAGWIAYAAFSCAAGAKAMRAKIAPVWFFGTLALGAIVVALVAGHIIVGAR
jgi:PTS system mannose-specific IIC component